MYVHTLTFTSTNELSRAFDTLTGSEYVEDCLVEPSSLQLRFVAPPDRAARLVEKIYLHGGISWCLRHRLGGDRF